MTSADVRLSVGFEAKQFDTLGTFVVESAAIPRLLPVCPFARSRWRGGRYRVFGGGRLCGMMQELDCR